MSKYSKWEPVAGIPSALVLEAIYDDYEGFRLLMRGEDTDSKILKILFDSASTYRAIDESYHVKFSRSDSENLDRYGLFIVEKSEYADWFLQTSQNIQPNVVHYAIHLSNQCLDVISEFPPEVTWL